MHKGAEKGGCEAERETGALDFGRTVLPERKASSEEVLKGPVLKGKEIEKSIGLRMLIRKSREGEKEKRGF